MRTPWALRTAAVPRVSSTHCGHWPPFSHAFYVAPSAPPSPCAAVFCFVSFLFSFWGSLIHRSACVSSFHSSSSSLWKERVLSAPAARPEASASRRGGPPQTPLFIDERRLFGARSWAIRDGLAGFGICTVVRRDSCRSTCGSWLSHSFTFFRRRACHRETAQPARPCLEEQAQTVLIRRPSSPSLFISWRRACARLARAGCRSDHGAVSRASGGNKLSTETPSELCVIAKSKREVRLHNQIRAAR